MSSVSLFRSEREMRRRAQLDEALCVHEASHYVCARGVGLQAERCSVDERGDGLAWYSYAVRELTTETGRTKLIAVALAGGIGERLRFGREVLGESASDRRKASELLMREVDQPKRFAVQSAAIDLATNALRARWDLVEAIAAELQDKGVWGLAA
jgi:purine-nucleoside phosphorylase